MATNAFYCKKCKKVTRQVEITAREYNALWDKWHLKKDHSMLDTIFEFGEDYIGLNWIDKNILGERCYKCCGCGCPTRRKLNRDEV